MRKKAKKENSWLKRIANGEKLEDMKRELEKRNAEKQKVREEEKREEEGEDDVNESLFMLLNDHEEADEGLRVEENEEVSTGVLGAEGKTESVERGKLKMLNKKEAGDDVSDMKIGQMEQVTEEEEEEGSGEQEAVISSKEKRECDDGGDGDDDGDDIIDDASTYEDVLETILCSSMAIGLHPDQAAEAIVDFAIRNNKPFAIVPCCVYSRDFPHRRLKSGVRVTTYEQLLQYLKEKQSGIQSRTLPMGGKNQVLFWHGVQ